MSQARLLLHFAAAVLPVIVAAVTVMLLNLGLVDALPYAAIALLAAQLAAFAGWPLLERSARRPGWLRAVLAGVFMALLTHLLFGLLLSARFHWEFPDAPGAGLLQLLQGSVQMGLLTLVLAGWASTPLLAVLCLLLQRLRRAELAELA